MIVPADGLNVELIRTIISCLPGTQLDWRWARPTAGGADLIA